MEKSNRIVLNTISQYLRTGICMVLTLYSTRIILGVLGKSDYGIYTLIGGLVVMLGFITTSLSTSTQRFLSYSWGKNDLRETKLIFSNAIFLHAGICVVLALVLLLLEPFIVHGYLKIDSSRIAAADFVYYMVVLILCMTFLTAPVKALFIARENIVFSSCVDVLDGCVKLGGAISLTWVTMDTLKAYAILMASISVLTFLIYVTYGLTHYEECHVPRLKEFSWSYLRQFSGFAFWNVYAVGSGIIRTQGLAVILNRFLGTMVNAAYASLVNAAYGIALQVSGAANAIAASIINSVNPQLMKAEGRGDRPEMLRLTTMESKYSYLILSTLLVPLIIEMPSVLTFWLGDYPTYSVQFCQMILASIIFDQTTIGLTSANQAIGKIRNYSLLISTLRLLILPAAWLCLYWELPVYSVMMAYLGGEIICGLTRIPFLQYTAGLNVADYCRLVYLKTLPAVAGNVLLSLLVSHSFSHPLRFILTEVLGIFVSLLLIYGFSLSADEKKWLRSRISAKFLKR